MDPEAWIKRFAHEIGLEPPGDSEIEDLLDLAATAAHSSERAAAPIACWLAGRSGRPAAELADAARRAGCGS